MSEITIKRYDLSLRDKWEDFVLNKSYNGTILQSRIFLEYHKDRFLDHSLVFLRGGNTIVAVCPACEEIDDGRKKFLSHKGSTFGGFVIGKEFNTITNAKEIVEVFNEYMKQNDFSYCLLKITGDVFCSNNNNLINYMLYRDGYGCYDELSFCIDIKNLKTDVVTNFKSKTRNLYKSSLKNNLILKQSDDKNEIEELYKVLKRSLEKYDAKPVHRLEELYDLKDNRLKDKMRFYTVWHEGEIIGGSVVFIINNVFHTQYLCANPDFLYLKPMDFLDGSLIILSQQEKFDYFSFGISTENHGYYLNETLAKFKEGFGSGFYTNKTYYKEF